MYLANWGTMCLLSMNFNYFQIVETFPQIKRWCAAKLWFLTYLIKKFTRDIKYILLRYFSTKWGNEATFGRS